MYDLLLCVTGSVLAIAGGLLFFFPHAVSRIERVLNRPCGARELGAIRLGLAAEMRTEAWLNKPLAPRAVVWDSWVRRYPRAAGAALWGIVAVGWFLMAAR